MSDDDILIAESVGANHEAFAEARAALQKRCGEAGITTEEVTGWDEGDVFLAIEMPSGREKYQLLIANLAEAESLLSIPFEKYCMLGEYVGVCCYQEGMIEAGVRAFGNTPLSVLRHRLFGEPARESPEFQPIVLEQSNHDNPLRVSLADPSEDFKVFAQVATDHPRLNMALRIENASVNTHDAALRLLERGEFALFPDGSTPWNPCWTSATASSDKGSTETSRGGTR